MTEHPLAALLLIAAVLAAGLYAGHQARTALERLTTAAALPHAGR